MLNSSISSPNPEEIPFYLQLQLQLVAAHLTLSFSLAPLGMQRRRRMSRPGATQHASASQRAMVQN